MITNATDNHPDFLYHYTSFETLALILNNRTICFNSLQNVDDLEEEKTKDMGNFGKYIYVSCWTKDKKEDMALWSMYTPNMHGIRIGLPQYPFKKYYYKQGDFGLERDTETYINIDKVYNENQGNIDPCYPELIEVQYTNDVNMLFPTVKKSNEPELAERFLKGEQIRKEVKLLFNLSYTYGNIGKYKRSIWGFQNEWRYVLPIMPFGMQELLNSSIEKKQELMMRINDLQTKRPYNMFFLELDENAVREMQILLGPRLSKAEKIYVKSLLKEHGLEKNCQESSLTIR